MMRLFFLLLLFQSNILFSQKFLYVDAINGNDSFNGNSLQTAFKTIKRAKNEVRTINQNIQSDIIIEMRKGTYALDSTLVFNEKDNGNNGFSIMYEAYQCERPIITGGDVISHWTIYNKEKNIFKASCPNDANARQFYVNGIRAIRARSSDASDWKENGDGYDCPSSIALWKNRKDIEIISYKEWKCHRGHIATIINNHATMDQPYWNFVHKQYDAPPVYIENALELLDSENEWYLDAKMHTIYYKPNKKEDIETIHCVLPRLEKLITCNNLSNIQFNGLLFSNTTWLQPNNDSGFACLQADIINDRKTQIPGTIVLQYCSNIQFNSCQFEHLGATALQLFDGCKNIIVYNNTFTDISASAIAVGNILKPFASPKDVIKDIKIINNNIFDIAKEYKGSVGIFAAYTDNLTIIHNDFKQLPYTAISLGWGWSNEITIAKNNEISFNRIDSVVLLLKDGGAIYTLSAQPGTTIHHNYISNQPNGSGALYPDQGSSYMNWNNNVVKDVSRWIHIWTSTIKNDTIENNYHNNLDELLKGENNRIQNNELVRNGNWSNEALNIIMTVGREKTKGCVPVFSDLSK